MSSKHWIIISIRKVTNQTLNPETSVAEFWSYFWVDDSLKGNVYKAISLSKAMNSPIHLRLIKTGK